MQVQEEGRVVLTIGRDQSTIDVVECMYVEFMTFLIADDARHDH